MKYAIFEAHGIFHVIVKNKNDSFSQIATCLNKANAEMITNALNAQSAPKKKGKKNAVA